MLGPIEVLIDDCPVELGGGNERALVAYLALHANHSVSSEAIIDALWGANPPATAREMVRTYVARARKRLGETVQRRSGGYVLDVPPEAVDVGRFERLCQEGLRQHAAGDRTASAETLARGLALWRGAPLPELQALISGDERVTRLEELRLAAIETRIDAELSLGRATAMVPELDALVREYPYRENLRRGLMLALYRSGRQTDALERYLEGRRVLVDEVGIEPSRNLQELQAAILRQDPDLDPLPSAPRPNPLESAARHQPRRRASRLYAHRRAGAVIVAIGLLAGAGLFAGAVMGGNPQSPQAVGQHALAVIDPASGAVAASLAIRGVPGPIAVGRGIAWLGDGDDRSVLGIDAGTLERLRTVRLGTFPYELATDGSSVWIGNGFEGTVTRVAAGGSVTRPFRPEPHATGRLALAYGAGSLWVGSQDGVLTQVDPSTNHAISVTRGVGKPEAIAIGGGDVWLAEADEDVLLRVDVATHRIVGSIPIGGAASGVAVGTGSVWAVTPEQGRLWRIDITTGAVTASIDVGRNPMFLATGNGEVWVGSPAGDVARVSPAQDAVTRTLRFAGPIGGVTYGRSRLWVTVR